jgi:hypothetical protein
LTRGAGRGRKSGWESNPLFFAFRVAPLARPSQISRAIQPTEEPVPPKYARLAGLGAFAACGAFVLLFLVVAYASRHTPTGGMMPVLSWVTWLSVALVILALVAVHVYLGRQLLKLAQGKPTSL